MTTDLNTLLWLGGMLFSLGIFAIKVGFGLGFSRASFRAITVVLAMYLVLFVVVAVLSQRLLQTLEPILRQGPYLHALMSVGMITWGIYLVQKSSKASGHQHAIKFEMQDSKTTHSSLITHHSLLLLVPCPVCLTAMTFSIWSALNVIKWHPMWVGLSVGAVFVVFSLIIYFLIKASHRSQSTFTQEVRLGLAMIAVGIYYIASLHIPAKVEEARLAYSAFLTDTQVVDSSQQLGVLGLMALFFVVGFFIFRPQGEGR